MVRTHHGSPFFTYLEVRGALVALVRLMSLIAGSAHGPAICVLIPGIIFRPTTQSEPDREASTNPTSGDRFILQPQVHASSGIRHRFQQHQAAL